MAGNQGPGRKASAHKHTQGESTHKRFVAASMASMWLSMTEYSEVLQSRVHTKPDVLTPAAVTHGHGGQWQVHVTEVGDARGETLGDSTGPKRPPQKDRACPQTG